MKSHFLVYTSSRVKKPISVCYDDADEAHATRDLMGGAAIVVRMLTGVCPVCGVLVSTAHADPEEIL